MPDHISCYQLTFEAGTPLWEMKTAGRVRPIGKKLESAFFIWTSRYLAKRGYHHYEISNFAKDRKSMCLHNQKYWTHAPYLGLGPSAHSFQAGRRWWNVKSVGKYCQLLAQGKAPVESSEVLSKEQLELEELCLGFRTSNGVDLHAPGGALRMGSALTELQRAGMAKVRNGRIQLTRKGFLVADGISLMWTGSR
jgi:oxygen-independent coproporphyrinogen-3 oxidase